MYYTVFRFSCYFEKVPINDVFSDWYIMCSLQTTINPINFTLFSNYVAGSVVRNIYCIVNWGFLKITRKHDLVDRYGISVSQMITDMFHLSRVNVAINPVIYHEWGKDLEVFLTSGTYPWSFVTRFWSPLWYLQTLLTKTIKPIFVWYYQYCIAFTNIRVIYDPIIVTDITLL
jgi:hypothetical protein